MDSFVNAAKVGELAPGDMKLVDVGENEAVLINVDGDLYAISDLCTHRDCPLSEGSLEGDVIECGCHGSRFNVRTGAVEEGPATEAVPVYIVKIEGGDILVGPA